MSDKILYNTLDTWKEHLPTVSPNAHKYTRGYALFWGSPILTGAVQLATLAARSIGTGIVGVSCTKETHPIYAAHMGLLTFTDRQNSPFSIFIEKARDPRVSALCIGPGLLPDDASFLVSQKESFLSLGKPLILDGGCLESSWLSFKRSCPLILAPHAGEWARLSGDNNGEEEYVQTWVEKNAVTVVLKGG
ncbi:MAG: ADP-dependent NAD(P)H-hydrate dehydratase [Candidatus Nucleicultricaceae bacterium]